MRTAAQHILRIFCKINVNISNLPRLESCCTKLLPRNKEGNNTVNYISVKQQLETDDIGEMEDIEAGRDAFLTQFVDFHVYVS